MTAGISPALGVILRGVPRIGRAAFLAALSEILGANQRFVYVPNGTDTTTSVESSTVGATITWDATIAARVTRQGNGYVQSFNGTDDYGDVPDSANLTFGNSTVDQALTFLALINPTDNAAVRTILSKFGASSTGEYRLALTAAHRLQLFLTDASGSINVNRLSDSGVTVPIGEWSLVAATYDGTGGSTAMNGATLYRNAAGMASTATNNASYVAMENQVSPFELGSQQTHIAPFAGSMGLVAMTQKALTPAEHQQVRQLCRRHFGVSL